MDVAQSAAFITSMTYETGILEYEDFPQTDEPVWILGTSYKPMYELDDIKKDILSRLWFTYRKGFSAIGSVGPVTDTGWGCMLRCGQMMLAQALVHRHLGKDWRWHKDSSNETYLNILKLFLDKKGACYSIHQIASMGVSEGKSVGSWFGPNTVAQVLRKLAVYDEWSSLTIHVALDNTVIMDDVVHICKDLHSEVHADGCKCQTGAASNVCDYYSVSNSAMYNGLASARNRTKGQSSDPQTNPLPSQRWRPLLLVIPLRLGLTEINGVYVKSLKQCLSFPQSVGIIGGKPNHALWFIGYVDNELIYLDPHTTQPVVQPDQGDSDESYHCQYSCRMNIRQLDPSIALGFYCGTEDEFNDLCQHIRKNVIENEKTPMFELYKERPAHYPPVELYCPNAGEPDFTMVERHYDTDEEFELL